MLFQRKLYDSPSGKTTKMSISHSTVAALHQRVRKGDLDDVKSFLKTLQCPKQQIFNEIVDDWNAVRVAVAFNRPLILAYLFENGAVEPPPRPKDGWTSLHVACFHGYDACVEVLLDARVTSVAAENDDNGRWPIHCAVQRDGIESLEHLLSHRTDQNCRTSVTRSTALHVAAEYGAIKCFTRLLETHRSRIALGIMNASNRSVLLEATHSDAPNANKCLEVLLNYFLREESVTSPRSRESESPKQQQQGVRLSRWEELKDGFTRCIVNGQTAQVLTFLKHDKFCDLLLHDGRRFDGVHHDSHEEPLIHQFFRTWNAAFVGSVIRGLLSWKMDQLSGASFSDFVSDFRVTLLTPLPTPHAIRSTPERNGTVAPLSLVFSSLNKRPRAMLEELFGSSGALRAVVQPSQDLIVDMTLLSPSCNLFNHGEFAVPFLPRDALSESGGCFLVHALLRFAATAGIYRRASFWKDLAVLVMDNPFLLPPVEPLEVTTPNTACRTQPHRWISEEIQLGQPTQCNIVVDAHRVELLRSVLESKFRGIVDYCATKRQA
ncbi:ankyrin repeat protein, putative [Bodo saltans]|uniref:Ankyrin repeat protein, putative n=1 Tax=Bodo saltans TaxID=75058 RepID=A0A0S4JEZ6_BODSA|nr:ankyrin repeat protein, putative [Bodo saltans]|eukprot:CUG88691.1 ankyrin repeat protein, putative [Bodo saltans]